MKRIGVLLCSLILCGLFAVHSTIAQGGVTTGAQGGDISKLVGNWSGESICVNKEKFPSCHDEQVIYRIVLAPGKPDTVTITADKLVNGQPETMGVIDFIYDAQKQMLTGDFKNSRVHLVIELTVKGEQIEGILATLPERTLTRRINLKKDE